ncbi:gliding motility-associated-like protein [Pedobacter sp. AK013]|uniref:PKD domain-containing protein n=1 Tax=Pedobacter sp. AK013 TaxID=2723071 RepID=UPI001609E9B6|nr:PKD domain-containing protein [Pedobacter sp. AK013]MBB6238837.1 gliding motility-associated-like protein [Pedobacter sp. AK013]
MSRHWLLVLFFLLFIRFLSFAQNTSNKGKDFYVPYAGHIDGDRSRLTLFLSADQATDYKVYIGGVLVSPVGATISANTCIPFVIDPNAYAVLMGSSNTIESNKAINVVTTKAISLYSIISNNARTGGTLVLPTNTLGQEYYAFSYENHGNQQGFSQFTIVATVDNTDIEITPKQNERYGGRTANTTFTIKLNKGDIYQYQSVGDLTGSHIKALNCNPVAVFTGNTWAAFCNEGNSRNPSGGDNLYQQVFPVSAWGKNFVTAPFYNTLHGNTDIMRIIVGEDNTVLTVNGSTTIANGSPLSNPYSKGAVVTFFSTSANVISGSKPIAVAQYQTSQTCNQNNGSNTNQYQFPGDPEITVLNPVEQTLNNITVFSDLRSVGVPTQILKYYLNVIIKTVDIASFRLDGNPVSNFTPIDNVFSYAVIDVTNTQPQHRLSAAGGFSAISYGYGPVESYAYLAGANIQNFTFQPTSVVTGQPITSGCLGEAISLTINLPYQAVKLDWEIQGAASFTDNNPVATSTITRPNDNNTYYTYKYPNELNYPTPGDYQFKVIATKPNADNCGNTEELIIDFSVDKQPTAAFELPATGCQSSGIQFTDISAPNSNSRSITQWLWDFGDEKTSTEQNPVHVYDRSGTYNVVLSVTTDSKCSETSSAFPIVINPQPLSDFDVKGLCVGKPIILTEKSTIENPGVIVKWTWDFGDGSTPANEQHPVHQYSATGSYTITLTTESDKGCVSVVKSKIVTVIDPQSADFELPGFCLADGVARFKNTSKNADGSTTGLTAQWTFTFNNDIVATSTDFDGSFTPTVTGEYIAALIVKNGAGCEMSKALTFTVNGDVKTADFEIINDHSCVSEDIMIKNKSTVFTGKITKIEIYRDFGKETSIYKTIPYPDNNEIFILNYDTFGGTADRTFNIRLVAYSGENCFKYSETQTLTLKPVPQLVFDDMAPVCEADGTVLITQAKQKAGEEMNGPPGVFSGDGIRADGTFNPKIAGLGPHTITYTFTGDNGCPNSISNTITVYKSPLADAGTLVYLLAGGQIEIPATAEGANLKYEWSPAIGLNKTNVLNPVASPSEDTEYTLTVTTQPEGCVTTSKVLVKVLQAINPPNTFTPNGDNVNDTWIIKYLESYPNATVEIFNRNGNRVFFSNGYKIPFDGNYQNEPLPVGVYYYIINPRNGRKTITGPLTIIR